MEKQVRTLLSIIRITPLLIILLVSILIINILNNQQEKELQVEQKIIEKQFIEDEKERIKTNIFTVYSLIKEEHKNLEIELKENLKYNAENVYTIIKNIYNSNINKKSNTKIIEEIKIVLRDLRFNNGRTYVVLTNSKAVGVLNPLKPEREGNSAYNLKDGRGQYPMRKLVNITKSPKQEGFFEYYFHKGSDIKTEHKKVTYVKVFKELDLVIAIGDYIDDFKLDVQNKLLKQFPKLKYKKGAHLYVITFDGDIIYHPSPKAMSTNIFKEDKYSHMDYLYKDLIQKKKKDAETFISIVPKVTEGIDTKDIKVNYIKRFDDWKWMIGSNFNISDANYIIEKRKEMLEKKYDDYKSDILLFGSIFTIFMLILSYFMSKVLEKKFLTYKENLEAQILENEIQNKKLKSQTLLLDDRRKELETIIQESPHPMILHKEGGEIIMINKAWSHITGFYIEETPTISDFVNSVYDGEETIIKLKKHIDSLYSITETIDEGEFTFLNKAKKSITWHVSSSPLGVVDEKRTIITSAVDVTLMKEKERVLLHQSKMAAMGEMIGNIAHQWRQPLSIISTAATGTRLQKEMDCLSDTELDSALVTINNSAQYLSQTIDDFRGFFNPKNSVLNQFKIEDTLIKTLKLVDPQFNVKNIEIIKNIENYELSSVENDLIQVLINILNNAKDALIAREKTRKLIFINTYQKDNTSYIEIIDNAGGIDDNIIDRIFEPYFTTKDKAQGTGIGLYMSEEILRNHLKGTITVENTSYIYDDIEYKGAKFLIEIE